MLLAVVALGGVFLLLSGRMGGSDPSPSPPAAVVPAPTSPSKNSPHAPAPAPASPSPASRESAPPPVGIPACDAYVEYAFHRCDGGSAQSQKQWRGIARELHDRFAKVPRVAWGEIAKACKESEDAYRSTPLTCN